MTCIRVPSNPMIFERDETCTLWHRDWLQYALRDHIFVNSCFLLSPSLSLHCLFPISPYYHPPHGVLSYTHFFLHNGYFLSAIYFNILTFYRVLLIRSYFWRTQCRLHRSCNWLSILNFSVGDPLLLVSCSLFSLPFFRSLCLSFSLCLPVFGHNLCY